MSAVLLASLAMFTSAQAPKPTSWEELSAQKPKQTEYAALFAFTTKASSILGATTSLTAEDAHTAAGLFQVPYFDYRTHRMRYELLLTAVALGNDSARKELPEAWDRLLICLGRPLRLAPQDWVKKNKRLNAFKLDRAPSCVFQVLTNSKAFKVTDKNNSSLQAIVDADQNVRQDFSKMTQKQLLQMQLDDSKRQVQTKAIVNRGELHTSLDFANASLVLQHSPSFEGYQLAHELAVCSMILGDKRFGRWLVTATYDRMLNSIGHDQRFGTQYGMEGHKRTDTEGICDSERVALGCPTLEESRNRVLK